MTDNHDYNNTRQQIRTRSIPSCKHDDAKDDKLDDEFDDELDYEH